MEDQNRDGVSQITSAAPIQVEDAGLIVWITLSRPTRANALDLATIHGLLHALEAAERSAARAVVLRGAGANFCGGADLAELLAGGADAVRTMMDPLRLLLRRLEETPLAVIAAVHGAARAGGLEIVLACDAVVAAETATFGDAHLANGLLPAGGATARLPRAIGWQRAKWLILSAAPISATTARDWGLVTEVCAQDALMARAGQLAQTLAGADRETFAKAKRLLAATADEGFTGALELEIRTLQAHASSPAFARGVSTFLRRRRERGAADRSASNPGV